MALRVENIQKEEILMVIIILTMIIEIKVKIIIIVIKTAMIAI